MRPERTRAPELRSLEPVDWQERPLGELIECFDQLRVPVKESERRPGRFPYYGASGVVGTIDDYIFDGEHLLIAEDGENLRTRKTPIAFRANGKFWVNNHAHIVRGNEHADTRYLEYALQVADIDAYLTGAVMPKLTQGNMRLIPVVVPPLAEQRAIASILGALDDKIGLNRRMNETLEGLARAVFKSWFVDFDPVRAKAAGLQPVGMDAESARLFPDRFVESEVGEVPEGWRIVRLDEAFEVNPERRLSRNLSAPYVEMQSLPTSGHRPASWPLRAVGSGARFTNGDTLLARITPCIENGKTGFVDFLVNGQVAWGSTEYIVLRSRPPLPLVCSYLLARNDALREFAIQHMEGSTGRQRVSVAALRGYPVTLPPASICQTFELIVASMFQQIAARDDEARTLVSLRDALLPKLLSGELRVRDAEYAVEAAT